MSSLEEDIIDVLEDAAANRASTAHLIDELDLRSEEFSVAEFEAVLSALQDEDVVRAQNPRAPMSDRVIVYNRRAKRR